jgi:dCMP deaminase
MNKHMLSAIEVSKQSNDPNTRVGAVIANADGDIICSGYNYILHPLLPTGRDLTDWINSKDPYVIHAETSAILNLENNGYLIPLIMHTTLFPCNECAKLIVAAGITKIFYLDDKYHNSDSTIAARRLFDVCGVKYEQVTE